MMKTKGGVGPISPPKPRPIPQTVTGKGRMVDTSGGRSVREKDARAKAYRTIGAR